MTELEKYKLAYGQIRANIVFGKHLERQIEAILNPPPEMEEIEVVRWACYWPDGVLIATLDTEDLAVKAIANDVKAYVVKLTGTIKRPVPQKVEKSCPLQLTRKGWDGSGLDISDVTLPLSGVFTWQK